MKVVAVQQIIRVGNVVVHGTEHLAQRAGGMFLRGGPIGHAKGTVQVAHMLAKSKLFSLVGHQEHRKMFVVGDTLVVWLAIVRGPTVHAVPLQHQDTS